MESSWRVVAALRASGLYRKPRRQRGRTREAEERGRGVGVVLGETARKKKRMSRSRPRQRQQAPHHPPPPIPVPGGGNKARKNGWGHGTFPPSSIRVTQAVIRRSWWVRTEDRRRCRAGGIGIGTLQWDSGSGEDASDRVSPWTLFLFYRAVRCASWLPLFLFLFFYCCTTARAQLVNRDREHPRMCGAVRRGRAGPGAAGRTRAGWLEPRGRARPYRTGHQLRSRT